MIEVLVAIAILAGIVLVVYSSFDAVTRTTYLARVVSDEMRMKQFLMRSFAANFASVYADVTLMNEAFLFEGKSGGGPEGPMDSIRFASSAPLMGGMAMPGIFKEVHYGAADSGEQGMTVEALDEDEERDAPHLESSEQLLASVSALTEDEGLDTDIDIDLDAAGYESPSWSVPIGSFDAAYYDGEEWVEEWDSVEAGRLPWGVRIRINYVAGSEEEEDAGSAGDEDADFEMYYPIPMAIGVLTTGDEWAEMYGGAYGLEGGPEDGENPDGALDDARRGSQRGFGRDREGLQRPRGAERPGQRERIQGLPRGNRLGGLGIGQQRRGS